MTVENTIAEFVKFADGKPSEFDKPVKFTNPHGKVVDVRFEAYHDVRIYEDGYEERFYIGE